MTQEPERKTTDTPGKMFCIPCDGRGWLGEWQLPKRVCPACDGSGWRKPQMEVDYDACT